jgi:hypothetical protein
MLEYVTTASYMPPSACSLSAKDGHPTICKRGCAQLGLLYSTVVTCCAPWFKMIASTHGVMEPTTATWHAV